MGPEIFVPFVFFTFLAAVIIVPIMAKEQTKRSAHNLISQAMARGQNLEPALIQELTHSMLDEGNRARKSLGRGVVLLALAGGILGAAFAADGRLFDGEALAPVIILASVGAAFLILALIDYAGRARAA